ncbi:MAG: hypothetical protein V7742_21190 [Halioglobus sp.]
MDADFIKELEYLEQNGFSEKLLSRIHHKSLNGGEVKFRAAKEYFRGVQEPRDRNSAFIDRVKYIAAGYRIRKGNFSQLADEALVKWPLS